MQSLDTTIVNTALPSIANSLHVAPLAMQPIVVAYTLTMAMLTPASGWLADRFGTRRVYFVGDPRVRARLDLLRERAHARPTGDRARAARPGRLDAAADRTARRPAQRHGRTVRGGARVHFDRRTSRADRRADARRLVRAGDHLALDFPDQRADRRAWGCTRCSASCRSHGEAEAPPFDFVGCGLLSLCMIAFSLAVDAPVPTHRAAWSAALFALAAVRALAYIPHAQTPRQSALQACRSFASRTSASA